MPPTKPVSTAVIRRLPRYYRFLGELLQKNVVHISSAKLSSRMRLTASQIRQDLNCFGGFGQQGYGYNVAELHAAIGKILGLDQKTDAILIGAGNLGHAVANHMSFEDRGFRLVGIFDQNTALVGTEIKGITVQHSDGLEAFCQEHLPKAAILCIPKSATPQVSERLIKIGIRAFWNFSHFDLSAAYDDIIVENVHMSDSLMTLSYQIHALENAGEK